MIHYQQCAVTIKLCTYEAVSEAIYWAAALNPQKFRVPLILNLALKDQMQQVWVSVENTAFSQGIFNALHVILHLFVFWVFSPGYIN